MCGQNLLHLIVIITVFERQDQYFQNVWPDNLLMLGLIFEYIKDFYD